MKLWTFILIFFCGTAFSEQWMLRFSEPQSHRFVHTGCYGTASYAWVGPTIRTLEKAQDGLLEFLRDSEEEQTPWVWSMNVGERSGTHLAMNLETGEIESVAQVFGHRKALVFCVCRKSDLLNCDRSGRLGALAGRPSFFIEFPKPVPETQLPPKKQKKRKKHPIPLAPQ